VFAVFGRSWELAKASLSVLRSDKELLIFPLISFIGLVLVSIVFFIPFLALGGLNFETGQPSIAAYAVLFVFYLVTYTVTFYFQTALVGAALIRLDGGDPTVRDGLRLATARLPQIIGYALIAATVGMILRWISERAGIVGQIIIGIVGFVWNIATFLVVPVLVTEGVGPVDAIKRSAGLLRRTWGEQLIGVGGIGIVFGLLFVAIALVGGAVAFALFNISVVLGIIGIFALVMVLGIVGLIGSAASGVYTASLYRYATKGDAGASFRPEVMQAAFRSRGGNPAISSGPLG
jgi:hypothetical protein